MMREEVLQRGSLWDQRQIFEVELKEHFPRAVHSLLCLQSASLPTTQVPVVAS